MKDEDNPKLNVNLDWEKQKIMKRLPGIIEMLPNPHYNRNSFEEQMTKLKALIEA